jgi:predicted dienelactone hydrolase
MKRVLAALVAVALFRSLAVTAQEAPGPTETQPDKNTEKKTDSAPAPNIAAPVPGKFKVATLADLKLTDEARKKDLLFTAVFPDAEGRFPVVIGSGIGTALPTYWASHGYVVLLPVHADQQMGAGGRGGRGMDAGAIFDQLDTDKDGFLSEEEIPALLADRIKDADTDKDGKISKDEFTRALGNMAPGGRGGAQPPAPEQPRPAPAPGGPKEDDFSLIPGAGAATLLDEPAPPPAPRGGQGRGQGRGQGGGMFGARESLEGGVDRVKDFVLLLDNLGRLGELNAGLKGKADPEKVAVVGHGFGAWAAGVIGGATVDLAEDKKAQSLLDKRVDAIIQLSGRGSGAPGLTKESFKGLKLPMLTMTGSNDTNPRAEGQGPDWKREAFAGAPEGGKFHVVIDGASAPSFTGVLAGEGPPRAGGRGGQAPAPSEAEKAIFGWVKSATLRFLDSALKGDESGAAWFNAEALKSATGGKLAVEKK